MVKDHNFDLAVAQVVKRLPDSPLAEQKLSIINIIWFSRSPPMR